VHAQEPRTEPVIDPHHDALEKLTRMLSSARRAPWRADECLQAVELVALVPGWVSRVARVLSDQRDAAAVDALLGLPHHVPGVVEGIYGALAAGVTRCRRDGTSAAAMLALDFRHSRAHFFEDALERARGLFGAAFEHLSVGGKAYYRFVLASGRGTLAGRAAAAGHDVSWLHEHLGRLRGTRLWLNGWCFPSEGPLRPPVQVHLVRGWLSWAASQTTTQGR
jgi:hypothetical protein